jgi:hypothetical protein
MADRVTVAKVYLADRVLKVRELQSEKVGLLLKAAEAAEEKSRDWSLSWELRQIHAAKAGAAREEARKLAGELGQ